MTKKKTVKELNEDVIILEDRVKELERIGEVFGKLSNIDLNELEKKIKMINTVNSDAKIAAIEKKCEDTDKCLKDLMKKNENTLIDKTKENVEYSCKKCQHKFQDKNNLSAHMIAHHPKEIKCKVCEETFDKRHKLESHLKIHELETLNCKVCEKSFHMKWRLEKHEKAHELLNVKFCHYFNNEDKCPYEEVGCMFKHEQSPRCRYETTCSNKLCQFQHRKNETQLNEENTSTDSEIIEPSEHDMNNESDSESDELECDVCGTLFETEDEFSEHQATETCGFVCEPCGVAFKFPIHLKKHMERHCTKCCEEFDTKELDEHKTTCKGIVFDY